MKGQIKAKTKSCLWGRKVEEAHHNSDWTLDPNSALSWKGWWILIPNILASVLRENCKWKVGGTEDHCQEFELENGMCWHWWFCAIPMQGTGLRKHLVPRWAKRYQISVPPALLGCAKITWAECQRLYPLLCNTWSPMAAYCQPLLTLMSIHFTIRKINDILKMPLFSFFIILNATRYCFSFSPSGWVMNETVSRWELFCGQWLQIAHQINLTFNNNSPDMVRRHVMLQFYWS